MKSFEIRDLSADQELDRDAMREIQGGAGVPAGLFSGVDILSPDFFNQVTPISGAASIPTLQTNNLAQTDTTIATNGLGINFVSNNKFADQATLGQVSDLLNAIVR